MVGPAIPPTGSTTAGDDYDYLIATASRIALTRFPILNDCSKIAPTRMPPGNLWRPTAASVG